MIQLLILFFVIKIKAKIKTINSFLIEHKINSSHLIVKLKNNKLDLTKLMILKMIIRILIGIF
jgi:hypothetical protein